VGAGGREEGRREEEGGRRKEEGERRKKTYRRIRNGVHAVFLFREQDGFFVFVIHGPHLHEHSALTKNIVHVISIFEHFSLHSVVAGVYFAAVKGCGKSVQRLG
jgi:hypothetical protein